MKNLKYFKLFEKFESKSLTKVFNYINSSERNDFKSILEKICDVLDFPLSKLSDELFQYLSFKKALYLNKNIEDEPCDNESDTIPGEKCSGPTGDKFQGTILRTWGRGRRRVLCDFCKGTGIKPKGNFEIKWIKFWFNKDGKYITTTITDGKIRQQNNYDDSIGQLFYPNSIKYRVIDNYVTYTTIGNYKTGDKFLFKANREPHRDVIATLWIFNKRRYMIQNTYQGSDSDISSDPESKEWRQYGKFSWVIVSSGDYSTLKYINIEKNDGEEVLDPYSWNTSINFRYMIPNDNTNMKSQLNNAHFSLVLDYAKMKEIMNSGEIVNKTTKKELRQFSIKGALALEIPNEIKSKNYSRYINKITSNIKISEDVSNLKAMFTRILGMNKAGHYILKGSRFDDMKRFLNELSNFMVAQQEDDKEYYLDKISYLIENAMTQNVEINSNIDSNLDKIVTFANSQKQKELVDKFIEINTIICQKISNAKVETIEDLIVVYNKIRSIRFEYRDNPLFSIAKSASDINWYLDNRDEYRSLRSLNIHEESDIDKILKNFDLFIKFIKKL